jgi:hypothetical protein
VEYYQFDAMNSLLKTMVKSELVPVDAMKAYRESKGIVPLILNLGATWIRMTNVTLGSLPPGKKHDTH